MFWVPQSGDIGMGVSILSYDGHVQFGLITDRGLFPIPNASSRASLPEFEKLVLSTLMAQWPWTAISIPRLQAPSSSATHAPRSAARRQWSVSLLAEGCAACRSKGKRVIGLDWMIGPGNGATINVISKGRMVPVGKRQRRRAHGIHHHLGLVVDVEARSRVLIDLAGYTRCLRLAAWTSADSHSGLSSTPYVYHVAKMLSPWCARLSPHPDSAPFGTHQRS